ncbi:hypothetical protein TWF730_004410 [Orbilia blumenaviensis]|uniref:Alkyl hydroperoxide reductase subunit C/ Thiol specific antioxidant domain-containing protein n=1 Tax=Orbilia blumenaviensis TaxID=1796055 RepID=A0AAV9U2G7_9PEZI
MLPRLRLISTPSRISRLISRSYHSSHLYPGQKPHPQLLPLLNTLSPSTSSIARQSDIWKIIFTGVAKDPVSTTTLKSFSELHEDLLARDTAILAIVPETEKVTKQWLKDIARSSGKYSDRPLDLQGEVSSRILGFPVIADPDYVLLKRLGFAEGEGQHTLVQILDPKNIIRHTAILPQSIGVNTLDTVRTLHALQTVDDYDILIPADWTPGRDALMPIGRHRTPAAVEALKRDLESSSTDARDQNLDFLEDMEEGVIRDRDDEGEIMYHPEELDADYKAQVLDNTMPPGETWEVLPYLRYVRIDDSVENSNSVIGYERMRTDLMRSFERYKAETFEKQRQKAVKEDEKSRSRREKAVMELLREAERGRLPRK